jgi:hypothetical protein
MATIIKLLIVVAILNAAVRGGQVAWANYKLEDEAQRLVQFGTDHSEDELHKEIMTKAAELSVPLAPEQVTVRRENNRTMADASYMRRVEWFPTVVYPVPFSFHVEAFTIAGATPMRRR